MKLTVACATDDGKTFTDNRFGRAKFYAIYEVGKRNYTFIENVDNVTIEGRDDGYGDPIKAKHMLFLLMKENVQILLSRNYGPNIIRMAIRFLPIILKIESIEEGLDKVLDNFDMIVDEHNKGADRKYISLD